MTLGEAIADGMKRVGEGDARRFTDQDWARWLSEAQVAVATRALCIRKTATLELDADVYSYAIPPELWKVRSVFHGTTRLREATIEQYLTLTPGVGTPETYTVWGGAIRLDAVPTTGGTLTLVYYATPAKLSTDNMNATPEIPEVYHPALVSYACYRMKQSDQALAEAAAFYQEFLREVAEATADCARETRDGPVWVEEVDAEDYE